MRYLLAASFCVLTACGCDLRRKPASQQQPTVPASAAVPTATMPTTASASALSRSAVMATVNGRPIYMQQLFVPLLESHSLPIAEMLIADALVAQEAERAKVTVTAKDVAAENDLALRGIFGEQLSLDQRDRVLTKLLRRRGITRSQWTATMRRNAILRKMVAPRIVVGEAMLKAEFARRYEEKVQISHIQLPSLTEAQKIIKMLEEKGDFAELARRYSTNSTTAARGGALPPFSRDNATLPRAMREAAFALAVDEISGIVQVGNEFHVLKLHKRFMPPKADYEAVKEKLRRQLRQHLIERAQAKMLSELRRKAQVEYVNPILRQAANRPIEP